MGYPFHRLARTLVLYNTFLGYGIVCSLFGPCILDLKEQVGATVGGMSFVVTLTSLGVLTGSSAIGLLMDRFRGYQHLVLSVATLTLGVCTSIFPFCPSLAAMYTVGFFSGLGTGALETGGTVQLLSTWSGLNPAPYMEALQFIWAVGCLLAPLIAIPFLETVPEDLVGDFNNDTEHGSTWPGTVDNMPATNSTGFWNIKVLFPLMGSYPIVMAGFLFFYFIRDWSKAKAGRQEEAPEPSLPAVQVAAEIVQLPPGRKRWLWELGMLGILVLFFAVYIGLEVSLGSFLSVFCVKSKLGLSRQQGAKMTALYFGSFATVRGLVIFAAVFLSPSILLWSSLITTLAGSLILACFGETTILWLEAGTVLMGAGMAAIFPTVWVVLESRRKVTNRIASVFSITNSIGVQTSSAVIGQMVEEFPMLLMYINLAITISCIILFTAFSLVTRVIDSLPPVDEISPLQDIGEGENQPKSDTSAAEEQPGVMPQ